MPRRDQYEDDKTENEIEDESESESDDEATPNQPRPKPTTAQNMNTKGPPQTKNVKKPPIPTNFPKNIHPNKRPFTRPTRYVQNKRRKFIKINNRGIKLPNNISFNDVLPSKKNTPTTTPKIIKKPTDKKRSTQVQKPRRAPIINAARLCGAGGNPSTLNLGGGNTNCDLSHSNIINLNITGLNENSEKKDKTVVEKLIETMRSLILNNSEGNGKTQKEIEEETQRNGLVEKYKDMYIASNFSFVTLINELGKKKKNPKI